jgi:hypothetical protein
VLNFIKKQTSVAGEMKSSIFAVETQVIQKGYRVLDA